MPHYSLCQLQAVQEIVKKIERLIYQETWDLQELEHQIRQQVLALGAIFIEEAFARLDEELRTTQCTKCAGAAECAPTLSGDSAPRCRYPSYLVSHTRNTRRG
jgi:hypothetical protein